MTSKALKLLPNFHISVQILLCRVGFLKVPLLGAIFKVFRATCPLLRALRLHAFLLVYKPLAPFFSAPVIQWFELRNPPQYNFNLNFLLSILYNFIESGLKVWNLSWLLWFQLSSDMNKYLLYFHCFLLCWAVNNKRITGGAMQLSFNSITLDYYPFHRAGMNADQPFNCSTCSALICWQLDFLSYQTKRIVFCIFIHCASVSDWVVVIVLTDDWSCCYFETAFQTLLSGDSCVHWMHYSEATKTREVWAKSLLDEFKSSMEMLKSAARDQQGPGSGRSSPQHGNRCIYSDIIYESVNQHVQM